MTNGEEQIVKSILQDFIDDSVPEYILEGARDVVNQGGVQKLDLKKREQYWDIDGQVQGDDFQNYSSEIGLNLNDKTINYYCNCPDSFSGVCRHVAATAYKMLKSLDSESSEEAPLPRTEWKQTFRPFFATELEPEAGRHYIIYRIYPELGRLQVAFFRARQNKSGISQVQNEVTLAQIVENPDWCDTSPALPGVAEQIGHYLDYWGHKVEIPAGLHSWFFRAVKGEYYLYLRESDQPVTHRIQDHAAQAFPGAERRWLELRHPSGP